MEEGRGGEKRDAFTSRILYIQLSPHPGIGNSSIDDRLRIGKSRVRGLLWKKKEEKVFSFPLTWYACTPPLFHVFRYSAIKSLRGLFPSRNYCILNDFYLECDSRASFIGINHPGEGELCMDRREIRSYGILFNIFSSTNVKRIYILLLVGNCFVQSATAYLTNRAKKNIYTEIKKRLKHQSQIITIILRPSPSSSILHPLRRPFLRSKDKRSKRSTAVDSQGQRCLKRRLVRRVTMLCGASCTAGATPGGFFERCGCSHPTRQKSV